MRVISGNKLDNGFRLLAVDVPHRYSAVFEVFVQIGSKYEASSEAGISHFMEHMAFKGSMGHPKASELLKELDSAGVSYNAGTGLESTSYYIKCLPEQLEWSSKLVSDILLRPLFEQGELEKERGVIEEEIAMYQDNPAMGLASEFMQKITSSEGMGCWNIIGDKKSLAGIGSKEMWSFRKKYFDPERCIGVVTVDFAKVGNIQALLDKIGQDWVNFKKSDSDLPKLKAKMLYKDLRQMHKKVEQAHLCVGFAGVERKSKDKYTARLVDILLAGNSSSRLVSILREEMGVAYYVQVISEQLVEYGMGGIQAGVKIGEAERVLERCKQEISSLSTWVTPEALKRVKDYLVGNILHQIDKVSFWSDYIGQGYLLDGEVPNIDMEIQALKNVTIEEIIRFSEDKLKSGNLSSLLLTNSDT